MTHPSESAGVGEAPVEHTVDSAAAALSQAFQTEPVEEEERREPAEQDDPNDELADDDFAEGDEPDAEESEADETDEQDEPEDPAIDAPVSLTADEKAAFSQLPKEAQDFVSSLEQRRNQDVQKVTTKAAEAQRQAEARAAQADIEAKARYAEQLAAYTEAVFPLQEPQPNWFRNQQDFDAAKANFNAQKAQHDQLMQQIQAIGTEANDEATKAFIEQRDRELMAIPEIANEETRKGFIDKAMGAAEKLGYDVRELSQTMDASDVKRLADVADAFAKAEKYDAARSRKMKRVRAGKNRNLKPGAAQPQRSGNKAYDNARQRLSQTGSVDDAAAAFKAIL